MIAELTMLTPCELFCVGIIIVCIIIAIIICCLTVDILIKGLRRRGE